MDDRKELDAFFHFFALFELSRPVTTPSDLSDGAALSDILGIVDSGYFKSTRPSAQPSDNWVLRFSALKRLYRLMTQYFADVLQKPTHSLDVPDLQAIAKDSNIPAILIMCRLTIAIGVHCEKNKEFIEKIQELSQEDQHCLMRAIETIMAKIQSAQGYVDPTDSSMTEDDHYYRIQYERSAIFSEKETLEKVYQSLIEEHRTLQSSYDDAVSEKEDALAQLRQAKRDAESRRNEKADVMLRAEMDRLRTELQKSEDNLAMAESELDKHTNLVTELTKKIDELQVKADEATRLKDQVDEYRHAADKLQKTENVMEKYKKKLQEGADLRQHVKSLEKQNADLVDKNATLEEEYRKVAAFKPLMESYKNQIADLEGKNSQRSQEIDTLKFQLDQARTKLKIVEEERSKDRETMELYQERVKELEANPTNTRPSRQVRREMEIAETATGDTPGLTGEPRSADVKSGDEESEDEDDNVQGLGGELDDALTGTTMTDLKLQIRKLQRELEGVRKNEADASRLLVLENLLEDANRMKTRYENDYLAAHREKLILQRDLEEIRSGKSMGDGAEAAIALRQRLNETVEQLETLRKEHAELEVKFDTINKELTIAKSDLTLVNKDQLDILASLRESVNEDKAGLEVDIEKLKKSNKELGEKNRMQLEQINNLLLEKVNLQSESIGHREKMLQRERDFGDLRATLSGKDLPEDIKARLLSLHEDNLIYKEQNKTLNDKLAKARQFIKEQDKLFKEQHAANAGSIPANAFEEAEASFRSQIKILEEEVEHQKKLLSDRVQQFRREQELMLSVIHVSEMKKLRQQMGSAPQSKPTPTAWLPVLRTTRSHILER
ncbi:hypothetical protein NP233_g9106 [Leucocoprinus birnbaumii]|uniref:HOOK-domain-containing protein n=1 Tax=Leucocoprinus birnbaumii TaxID=56174 RepID=A0AAD5YT53_9AGAR|nr:hypothetical protein NP233_g9106 [Leucocoprinus birnbaumii]